MKEILHIYSNSKVLLELDSKLNTYNYVQKYIEEKVKDIQSIRQNNPEKKKVADKKWKPTSKSTQMAAKNVVERRKRGWGPSPSFLQHPSRRQLQLLSQKQFLCEQNQKRLVLTFTRALRLPKLL